MTLHLYLRRYLLGILQEEEAELLDEVVVVNDDVAALLCIIEDELVDAYVSGRLGGELLAGFESFYLASPHRRSKVSFAAKFLRLMAG
jgi:hypothetical protein